MLVPTTSPVTMEPWMRASKKRKAATPLAMDDDEDGPPSIPFLLPKLGMNQTLYSHMNHVYFNDDINNDSVFALNKELRTVETRLKVISLTHGMEPPPIFLHITTDGGSIHAAFSAVDCIQSLSVPVYSVVDGFVASAGTLISLSAKKRFIRPNAYMLIHELRSGVWGKMSSIEEEVENLKKVMDHIHTFYLKHTPLTKKQLEKILCKDVIWNAEECLARGVADEMYKT
jgi:ATP-dependent protease ClpP protease subunit